MKYRLCLADSRLFGRCIYCGGFPDTREHVPSKALLDKPYPEQLSCVESCKECNNDFSLDETYLSCILECARCGSIDPNSFDRLKIKNRLIRERLLPKRIARSAQASLSFLRYVHIEKNRVRRILTKLCQGHAAYELSETSLGTPSKIMIKPILQMTPKELSRFEKPIKNTLFPEVGSRQMIGVPAGMESNWVIVQEGRYRFMAGIRKGIIVKVVMSEYLACEVEWSDVEKVREDIAFFWRMKK